MDEGLTQVNHSSGFTNLKESWRTVIQRIRNDPMAVDANLSFFAAVLQSYRWDSILKPFPPMYLLSPDNEKDIERLVRIS